MVRSGATFLMPIVGLCFALSNLVQAQFDDLLPVADSIKRDHYLILAAENTALQKYFAGKKNGKNDYVAYLLVDGQSLLAGQDLNLQAIDWAQLKEDLQAIYHRKLVQQLKSPPKRALMIHTYFTGNPGENSDFINWTFGGFSQQSAHFEVVNLVSSFSGGGQGLWEKFDAIVGDHEALVDPNADETPKENDYVQVYPVRTFLSRLASSNADCVVVIKPKFSVDFSDGLPRSIRTSMSVFSRQLQFDQKTRVLFSFGFIEGGEAAKDWFMSEGARELQHALGFQSSVITIGYE